ncbi:MAG: ribbon-helix-helix domain-containing protein [bacterium]|nr:ribbon-helix-helix domain-containing protein [bacterium]
MAVTVKTAVSLPEYLFEEVDTYAKTHHQSRSSVIRLALEKLLNAYQDQKTLLKAKEIYAELAQSDQKLAEDFLSISSETLEVDG